MLGETIDAGASGGYVPTQEHGNDKNLANDGTLAAYLTQKSYLDFVTLANTPMGILSPTTGFWVNKP